MGKEDGKLEGKDVGSLVALLVGREVGLVFTNREGDNLIERYT